MNRRRCVRGHFIPATAPTNACRCLTRPRRHRARLNPDLLDQRIPSGARITDVPLTGSYL